MPPMDLDNGPPSATQDGASSSSSNTPDDGAAAFVILAATHERALEIVPLEALRELAVDVPSDPGALAD